MRRRCSKCRRCKRCGIYNESGRAGREGREGRAGRAGREGREGRAGIPVKTINFNEYSRFYLPPSGEIYHRKDFGKKVYSKSV